MYVYIVEVILENGEAYGYWDSGKTQCDCVLQQLP